MSRTLWTREADRAFSRKSHDGWTADVWRSHSTLSWRYSITTPWGNTTISTTRANSHQAAKMLCWTWLERTRAHARNVLEVTL